MPTRQRQGQGQRILPGSRPASGSARLSPGTPALLSLSPRKKPHHQARKPSDAEASSGFRPTPSGRPTLRWIGPRVAIAAAAATRKKRGLGVDLSEAAASFPLDGIGGRDWDDSDTCICIVPQQSGSWDAATSCVCIAPTSFEEEEEESFANSSTDSVNSDSTNSNFRVRCASEASRSSDCSKLSVGVHFADEMGLPFRYTYYYDREESEPSPPGNPRHRRDRKKTANQSNTPWEDPPCEPSNRWFGRS